jgi:hypothetical protein
LTRLVLIACRCVNGFITESPPAAGIVKLLFGDKREDVLVVVALGDLGLFSDEFVESIISLLILFFFFFCFYLYRFNGMQYISNLVFV